MGETPGPEELNDAQRDAVRAVHARVRAALPGFKTRAAQLHMVAAVARAFAVRGGVAAIEAPTGTGKSIAYLIAAVPLAQALGKRLVLSTATVALQEQLLHRDLPAFLTAAGLDLPIELAKGRQRYACTRNLFELIGSPDAPPQGGFEFGEAEPQQGSWPRAPRAGEVDQVRHLLESLQNGQWNGDLDRSPINIAEETRPLLSTSAGGCSNRRCPHITQCAFVQARNRLQTAPIVIANHDLVLADLSLGRDEEGSGGVLLPAPADTLYVFDEAHHLASKAIERGSGTLALSDARRKLPRLAASLRAVYLADARERIGRLRSEELDALLDALQESLDALARDIETRWTPTAAAERPEDARWLAPLGELPQHWVDLAAELATHNAKLLRWAPAGIKAVLESELAPDRRERLARELGLATERLQSQQDLFELWARPDPDGQPPHARWIEPAADATPVLRASAVSAAAVLKRLLWQQASGVVLTSATLSLGGDFRAFASEVGMPQHAEAVSLPSPFDLSAQATLELPRLAVLPDQGQAYANAVAAWLDTDLQWDAANLVLFTSRQKLEQTLAALPANRRERVLAQGAQSKSRLLEAHANAVAAGQGSTLFGLASFGEGLDLPGRLCETVVITQLPFAVPTDPVGATYSAWLETRGRNPFLEVTVPQATRTLVQYCGRLVRSEADRGRVVILDRRILEKQYGARMLRALPPFRRSERNPAARS
ncbi:MAG: ATP-dependent DNA helicase DinG [Aquimonas sp.]|nr:ATP-dependent DNA helicase DinG [Aquimonas sp.]